MLARHPVFLATTGAFCVFLVVLAGVAVALVSARVAVADALGERLTVRLVGADTERTVLITGVRCYNHPATGVTAESVPNDLPTGQLSAEYSRIYDTYEIAVSGEDLRFQSDARFEWDGDTIRFDDVAGAALLPRPLAGDTAEVEAVLSGTLTCRVRG